ncbi:unnamed protein product [Acanthosepion pharaonis]|uniref:Uncharacterized protein n=1 Tax=Acanthosepion pharaonis TaxID=158019 RepID=A0A812EJ14_ACAPH|nr:unnamed protein product [Sepia pharaonis]
MTLPPPICLLLRITGSPFLDHVHHPPCPSNLKRFSSVNITFLKSTWFVIHLLALPSHASLCFLVSVIFFLILAYLSPISCSFLCTDGTLTSSSHFSFTFFAVTFSRDDNNLVALLFIFLSVLLEIVFFSVLYSSSSAHSLYLACIQLLTSLASSQRRSFGC